MNVGWWTTIGGSFYGVKGSGWRLVLPDPGGDSWQEREREERSGHLAQPFCCENPVQCTEPCHFGGEARREPVLSALL